MGISILAWLSSRDYLLHTSDISKRNSHIGPGTRTNMGLSMEMIL